jgi:hypothetical protein
MTIIQEVLDTNKVNGQNEVDKKINELKDKGKVSFNAENGDTYTVYRDSDRYSIQKNKGSIYGKSINVNSVIPKIKQLLKNNTLDKLIESGGSFKGINEKTYTVIKNGDKYSIKTENGQTYGPVEKASIIQIAQKIKNEQTSEIKWKSPVKPSVNE